MASGKEDEPRKVRDTSPLARTVVAVFFLLLAALAIAFSAREFNRRQRQEAPTTDNAKSEVLVEPSEKPAP